MHIKVPSKLRNLCIRALSESMETRLMTHMIREIFPSYDIYSRTGFPASLAIPNVEVATQIVKDVISANQFPAFVALLIKIHEQGLMGRKYPVSYLREIVKGTYELGFIYDTVNRLFIEDPKTRHSQNWGVLQLGEEYTMSFLSIDIVGNTKLVRSHKNSEIQKAYKDLREIVYSVTNRRNGRIWNWEGDGGIVAFFFENKHMSAVLSSMEIIHELFLYNRTGCKLKEPLNVRIAVHAGPCEYTDNGEELKQIQTIKDLSALEKRSKPNGITISIVIKVMLEEIISRKFKPVGKGKNGPFSYSLQLV